MSPLHPGVRHLVAFRRAIPVLLPASIDALLDWIVLYWLFALAFLVLPGGVVREIHLAVHAYILASDLAVHAAAAATAVSAHDPALYARQFLALSASADLTQTAPR